jgi:hypothetical protein
MPFWQRKTGPTKKYWPSFVRHTNRHKKPNNIKMLHARGRVVARFIHAFVSPYDSTRLSSTFPGLLRKNEKEKSTPCRVAG